jgi:hypothetical protein
MIIINVLRKISMPKGFIKNDKNEGKQIPNKIGLHHSSLAKSHYLYLYIMDSTFTSLALMLTKRSEYSH